MVEPEFLPTLVPCLEQWGNEASDQPLTHQEVLAVAAAFIVWGVAAREEARGGLVDIPGFFAPKASASLGAPVACSA